MVKLSASSRRSTATNSPCTAWVFEADIGWLLEIVGLTQSEKAISILRSGRSGGAVRDRRLGASPCPRRHAPQTTGELALAEEALILGGDACENEHHTGTGEEIVEPDRLAIIGADEVSITPKAIQDLLDELDQAR